MKDEINLDKEPEETVYMLALDNKCNLINYCEVARGSLTKSIMHPREVYKRALVSNASSIILAHNHPSGNCMPSNDDIRMTSLIKRAGDILDVNLVDHIILGDKDYYSFFDNNFSLVDTESISRTNKENKISFKRTKNNEERSI